MRTVEDLVAAFRDDEKDLVEPLLWSDRQLIRWANQAVSRFCEITRSVYDQSSAFTTIDLPAGEGCAPRHPCIIDIVQAWVTGPHERELDVISPGAAIRRRLPRDGSLGVVVVDDRHLRFHPVPQQAATIQLSVIRRPVSALQALSSPLTDVPISERENLLLFMKHRAYRVSDAEVFDPAKADNFLAEFERACQVYHETAGTAAPSQPIRFKW